MEAETLEGKNVTTKQRLPPHTLLRPPFSALFTSGARGALAHKNALRLHERANDE